MKIDVPMLLIGVLLIVGGFVHTGSYNRAFARGKPDYQPNPVVRAMFLVFGVLLIADSLLDIF